MIFGKTDSEVEFDKCRPKVKFVWFPTKLDDGRWVWLEKILFSRFRFNGNLLNRYEEYNG